MNKSDIETFEKYVESRPEYYFDLDKYSKDHDLQVWIDATKWERKRTQIMVDSLKSYCDCDQLGFNIKCVACNALKDYLRGKEDDLL